MHITQGSQVNPSKVILQAGKVTDRACHIQHGKMQGKERSSLSCCEMCSILAINSCLYAYQQQTSLWKNPTKRPECKHANLGGVSIAFSFVQNTDALSSKRDASVRCLQSAHHLGEELCSWLQLYVCQCKGCSNCSAPIILRHTHCCHCWQNIWWRR